jgi:site-specific recombinase XerC
LTSLKKDQLGPEVTTRVLVQKLRKDGYKISLIARTLSFNRTYCYSLLLDKSCSINRKKVQRIMQEESLTVPVKERMAKRTRNQAASR